MLRIARARSRRSLISLTPLIDVVFILLVFFMLASSFVEWRSIDLAEAGPAAATPSEDAALLLRVGADGGVVIDGEAHDAAALDARLARIAGEDPARRLAVQPEPGVPLQTVVDVLEAATEAGLSGVSLVRPAGEE